ncbi:MAG: tRNA (N(6)-L-threonylcarbamoyladenosine(37)-C(2))-methylthiotransferase MtaB [Chloroflexi bacterium RBG_13_51_36]|nr:MAG: tRNA (N(6)-L-threonylcarbamoyladenosine(37)-C(2))-methylthiotransferase MtaB [Chloroflexi bacterium RBG_13_51_36]
MRVALDTLGCKLNQAETESLAGQFSQSGFELVSPDDVADIYVANTCTVTHVADRKSRHWLRLARRRNPQALIVATGCYAQRSRQELTQLADLVVDNTEKEHLVEIVQGLRLEGRGLGEGGTKQSQISATARTRALTKIQDGCHGLCTYCIVPKVRPHEYSLPVSRIIDEVKQKAALGYKEVVLTGTKVGSYKDAVLSASEGFSANLTDLLRRILNDTDIERLRLSSLQPSEISSELLALWQGERLCRHFHLALQSGSEAVLQRMKRSYSLDEYQRALNSIKEAIPEVAITTDIMVGFPGESDEEFEQSHSFYQQAGFANIHVFPFSPRPETAAARMPKQIKSEVKEKRKQRMLELSQSCRRRFCEQLLGQAIPVLWEKETRPNSGIYSGLTNNYIRVFAHSERPLSNVIAPVKLVELHDQGIWGEIVNENPG